MSIFDQSGLFASLKPSVSFPSSILNVLGSAVHRGYTGLITTEATAEQGEGLLAAAALFKRPPSPADMGLCGADLLDI